MKVAEPMSDGRQTALSPDQAVDRLETMHSRGGAGSARALARFAAGGAPPDPASERGSAIPNCASSGRPTGPMPATRRAWGKFQAPGVYATTVTQPGFFRRYLLEQLRAAGRGIRRLASRCAAATQEMPYPYVLDRGDELAHSDASPAELARHFPTPLLSAVGDEVADGLWTSAAGQPLPLALFDAVRVDYSLRRLLHYTGTDWRAVQPWILLTNYQRYVDQFVRWAWTSWRARAAPTIAWCCPAASWSRAATTRPTAEARARRRALAPVPDARLPPLPRRTGRAA